MVQMRIGVGIITAIGYSGVQFGPNEVTVKISDKTVVENGLQSRLMKRN